jgi:hypothetical protein
MSAEDGARCRGGRRRTERGDPTYSSSPSRRRSGTSRSCRASTSASSHAAGPNITHASGQLTPSTCAGAAAHTASPATVNATAPSPARTHRLPPRLMHRETVDRQVLVCKVLIHQRRPAVEATEFQADVPQRHRPPRGAGRSPTRAVCGTSPPPGMRPGARGPRSTPAPSVPPPGCAEADVLKLHIADRALLEPRDEARLHRPHPQLMRKLRVLNPVREQHLAPTARRPSRCRGRARSRPQASRARAPRRGRKYDSRSLAPSRTPSAHRDASARTFSTRTPPVSEPSTV